MLPQTINEVIVQLDDIICKSKEQNNALGYFAALYKQVTIQITKKLGTGYFDDDERMERLDVIFATRYLSAYTDYCAGKPISQSWQKAFDLSKNNNLIVLEHLLLGMNAHINLDLGIAAAAVSTPSTIDDLEEDFKKINELLATLVGRVEQDLGKIWPTLFSLLKYTRIIDDLLINFSMQIARASAWKFANRLVQKTGAERMDLIAMRDANIAVLGGRLITHKLTKRTALQFIRVGEKGTVADRIATLEE